MMQRYCLIMCRSLTYAQQSVSKTGCTYCVKLYESRLVRALALLDRAAIRRGKVYRLLEDGTYQEVTV